MEIVLASQSPRRKEILSQYLDKFIIEPSSFDESTVKEIVPYVFAEQAALFKAKDLTSKYPNSLIIGGDTIVVYNDIILGKPKDRLEAQKTLEMLSGQRHQVVTGLCLYNQEKDIVILDHQKTDIVFNQLSEEDIYSYLEKNSFLDKAGSYAIQDIGDIFVKSIEGDYNNVVGFPLDLFITMYSKFGLLIKGV